jgi:hypothetical protein
MFTIIRVHNVCNFFGRQTMTLREELLKIKEEVRAKYAKQKEKEAA